MKKIEDLRLALNRSILVTYRVFAVFTLYTVLLGVLLYALVVGFYAINTSWLAPVILSPSDDKSLDLNVKMVTTQLTMEDLVLDVKRLESSIAEMKKHKADLSALQPEIAKAIARERAHDRASAPELSALNEQKNIDNRKTKVILTQVNEVEQAVDRDLAAGLMTKGDAATLRAQLNQAYGTYTDSRISEVLLRDSILQKNTLNTTSLDVLDKQAELNSEIAQLDISIAVSEKQLQTEQSQVQRLSEAVATAMQTAYYPSIAQDSASYFAFVPYDNEANVSVGAPIYDCYLDMLLCRKVGAVKRIFPGEEHGIHPIFRTDIRGLLVQLELDHPGSAKSRTVFVNRKPLLF